MFDAASSIPIKLTKRAALKAGLGGMKNFLFNDVQRLIGWQYERHIDELSGVQVTKLARSEVRSDLKSDVRKKSLAITGSQKKIVRSKRSEYRLAPMPKDSVAPAWADRLVKKIRKNAHPTAVFVDAEDWGNLSTSQKQEYFFVALSRSEARIIVYNERGQTRDKDLAALLKLERVQRTDRDLDQAVGIFARSHVPTVHLSKQVLPSRTSIGSLRKRVSFFKMKSDKSGSLATALLWAISGGEDIRMPGVRQEDGFWTVEESLLDSLQRIYDNNFVIAVAA